MSQTWLKTYGYLLARDPDPHLGQDQALQSALASMQRFYGLPVTGRLDKTTVA